MVHDLYWQNEKKCRKYSKIIGSYVFFHIWIFIAILIFMLYCIIFGNFDSSSRELPFYMILPFDETQIMGWLCTWFSQTVVAFTYALCMTVTTAHFVSCCFYIVTMCNQFELIMSGINVDVERNQHEKNQRKFEINRLKIVKQFSNAIEFHNKIIE